MLSDITLNFVYLTQRFVHVSTTLSEQLYLSGTPLVDYYGSRGPLSKKSKWANNRIGGYKEAASPRFSLTREENV